MARLKATNVIYQSRAEFEQALDTIASLQLELEHSVAAFNEKKAAEDKRFKTSVKRKKERISEKLASCEMFVAHHRGELLGDKQGAETKNANYGYRKSPGIVKTLNSKWTLGKCLESIKAAGLTACVKVTESLNKNAVKDQLNEAEMAQHGLRLDYPEEFWVEAKRAEETPAQRLQ